MQLFLIYLFCTVQPLYHFYSAAGDQDPDAFHRYIVEQGFKPAIFGSYNYDPIRQVFEQPKRNNSMNQIVNETYVLSTAVGTLSDPTTIVYRNRPTDGPTSPTPSWWARKLKSTTSKKHILSFLDHKQ